MSTTRALVYCCANCGTKATALYENGDRAFGDLPDCKRGCQVPFAVMDAIASWLDERGMQGEGDDIQPTRAHLCGYDAVER